MMNQHTKRNACSGPKAPGGRNHGKRNADERDIESQVKCGR
jgi:hypothetical protein